MKGGPVACNLNKLLVRKRLMGYNLSLNYNLMSLGNILSKPADSVIHLLIPTNLPWITAGTSPRNLLPW